MGIVVSFTRITAEHVEQLDELKEELDGLDVDDDEEFESMNERAYELWEDFEDPEPTSFDGYLDKAWAGLQFLLDAEGIPIQLREDVPDFMGDGWGLSVWPAAWANEVARHLRATPFETLARHFDPARMTAQDIYPGVIWERDGNDALLYLKGYYEGLVQFFDAAAAAQSAVVWSMG